LRRRDLLALGVGLCAGPPLAADETTPWPEALQREARAILDDAAREGLDPTDYRGGPVEDALRRFLRDLHAGRVRPRDLGFGIATGRVDDADVEPALQAALAGGRLRDAVDRLTPTLVPYRQLRTMLERYRAIAAGPVFDALAPIARKLVPGDAYAGIAGLRQRLLAYGDLPADAATSQTHYDALLAEGVRRFQARHGLDADGVIGRATIAALNVPPAQRVRQIELGMERLRWLRPRAGTSFVAINIPMFRLWAWSNGAAVTSPALRMSVIVGKAMRTQTPVFADEMTHLIFRPYWNVPRSILRDEVLPAVERDPSWLARHDMEIVSGQGDDAKPVPLSSDSLAALRSGALRVRQRPGPKNSLGLVKFIFPNDANVYLHGTPARALFARSRRDFSHGCVRVEDPTALALWLLRDQPDWTRERIEAAMDADKPQQVNLTAPVPVTLYYITAAVVPEDGTLHFAEDIYRHDAALERALRNRSRP
jgi:murein L,D-transpeptidase YcbB/YkuD